MRGRGAMRFRPAPPTNMGVMPWTLFWATIPAGVFDWGKLLSEGRRALGAQAGD